MSNFMNDPDQQRKLFQEIADLKVQKKEIEDDLRKKEAIAYAVMDHNKVDKIETSVGNFVRVFMPVWEFSPAVAAKEEEVKALKEKEKEDGIAKVKSNRAQLRYNAPKGE